MNYFVPIKCVVNTLTDKYNAKEITLKEITELFPCIGYENGEYVELEPKEQTITLYTEDEITATNYLCYLIDDKSIISQYTDLENSGGIMPEKVLTVLGLNERGSDIIQLFTCFGKCYSWYNDLIELYVSELVRKINEKLPNKSNLIVCDDGLIKFKVSDKSYDRFEIDAHLNSLKLFKGRKLLGEYYLDENWIDKL